MIFAMAWSQRDLKAEPGLGFRLAIGSFIEEYANKVQIVQRRDVHEQQAEPAGGGDGASAAAQNSFVRVGEFDHPYPATKILWSPDRGAGKDLLATTGDYLRVWNVVDAKEGAPPADGPGGVKMVALLNNNKNSEYCAPLTSFDWNETDPSLIGTSSIDTTCTIWDLNVRANSPSGISRSLRGSWLSARTALSHPPPRSSARVPAAKTQLIAHDRGVRYRVRSWQGHLRLRGCRRLRSAVRPQEPRTFDHHL